MNNIFNSKNILVTGGAGFIGSALVKKLVNSGANVSVIDNLWRGKLENLSIGEGKYVINMDTNFHLIDLTDYSKSLELIRDYDYVYHLADIVAGINFVFDNEMYIYQQNMRINSNVLSACIINNISNYIYVGTACSFPMHLQMQDKIVTLKESQTYPAAPESSYGWSKLMGEYEASLMIGKSELNIGLLRFHNVYGPGSDFSIDRSQVLPSLCRKAVNFPDEEFIVWGSGSQYRDFVYIDDIIEALLLVAHKGMNKGLIQIGSEAPVSIKEAAETVINISNKDIDLVFDTTKPEGDRGRIGDCSIAHNELGWFPRVSFGEGMINLYNFVKDNI
jgi:GDP-D-mannose 3', 5'-epimerase